MYVPETHVYVSERHAHVPETHVYVAERQVYVLYVDGVGDKAQPLNFASKYTIGYVQQLITVITQMVFAPVERHQRQEVKVSV